MKEINIDCKKILDDMLKHRRDFKEEIKKDKDRFEDHPIEFDNLYGFDVRVSNPYFVVPDKYWSDGLKKVIETQAVGWKVKKYKNKVYVYYIMPPIDPIKPYISALNIYCEARSQLNTVVTRYIKWGYCRWSNQ